MKYPVFETEIIEEDSWHLILLNYELDKLDKSWESYSVCDLSGTLYKKVFT